jgi:hypothetical protein
VQNEDFGEYEWESCDEEDDNDEDIYNYEIRDTGKRYKQKKNEPE